MDRSEVSGVTGGAVTRCRLTVCDADQTASSGVVTAGTSIVRIGCCTDQSVIVTGRTSRTGNGDNTTMIRRNGVRRLPGAGMAGGTVTASGEVFANSDADQTTGGIVTTCTGIMSIGCCADQGVVVAVGAVRCPDLNQ